jgi:hypothetical protein
MLMHITFNTCNIAKTSSVMLEVNHISDSI